MSFYFLWLIAVLVLLLLAGLAGRASKNGWLGILIDGRGRYSLSHLQIVLWTVLVLSTMLALFFYSSPPTLQAFAIPQTLLLLMGISVGSAATAGAIKSGKAVKNAAVQVKGVLPAAAIVPGSPLFLPPHPAQVVLQEEGPLIDKVVDVTKFQNLIFTLVLGATYVVLLLDSVRAGTPGYPNLDAAPNLLWLLGISHAGYLAGKLPDKPTQSNDGAIRAAHAARVALTTKTAVAAAPAGAQNPTWDNAIRDLFNPVDVNHMLQDPGGSGNPLDLGDYASVKANGPRIYQAVSSNRMPRPPSEKWTDEMKATFKQWMDNGYPES
jgi:hypothetical protein